MLVRAILEDRYDIDEYEAGAEALEGMRGARPDLVLLDISLPGMDGTEVLRNIREDDSLRALPVNRARRNHGASGRSLPHARGGELLQVVHAEPDYALPRLMPEVR